MNGSATTIPASRNRFGWVDIAKGICIVAVVCLYAKNYLGYVSIESGWLEQWTRFAKPFRMPDFFLLSGLFLSRVIDRPWRSYLDTKVVHYVYFIMLWTVFYLAWELFMHPPEDISVFRVLQLYAWHMVHPVAMLWFIQTLSAFFVVTRLLRRVPKLALVGGAAVLATIRINTGFTPLDDFFTYYVYFLVGYAFAHHIFAGADWVAKNRSIAWIAFFAWIVGNTYVVWQGWSLLPGVEMVVGFIGISAIIGLSSLISEYRWADWIRYLGSHSIVVYLGFYLPLQWWVLAYSHSGLSLSPHLIATLTVVVGIAGAIVLNWLVRGTSLNFLFKRPRWAHLVAPRSAVAAEAS